MQLKKPIIYNLSVVLVGNFNPSIVNPSWLAYKKLIRESEAENASIKIIHPEVSNFSLSFVDIHITSDKFILTCDNEADFDLTKDLVISVFTFLNETPISGIGLNHITHFGLQNKKQYDSFGSWLSPHSLWEGVLRDPKLLEIRIVEQFEDNNPVKNMVVISPSEKIKNFGVQFKLNYHIELSRTKTKHHVTAINNNWEKSFEKSKLILNSLIERFNG